ncbi:MAG: DUF4258 domain-containing protein [Phycisphaerales bacterium]|nr:DUF4258 domain-containing protein [Phycisphaerales bacterium]
MELRFTQHAEHVIGERKLQVAWIERAVQSPERIEEAEGGTRHFLARIVERDVRILRVVVDPVRDPWVVVTAFLDRRMKGQIP